MNTSELKKHVLAYLAEQYEIGNGGMVALSPLVLKLNISFNELRPVIGMLHEQGVLNTVVGEQHAMLTSRGIELALPLDPAVPKLAHQTVNFNGPINHSAIAMNQGHAEVSVSNTHVQSFVSNLTQAIDQVQGVSEEKKLTWKQTLLEISKHPALAAALTKLVGG